MNKAEEHFKKWLDDRDYSYFFVDQTPDTFARFFKGVTKRPDFIVVINRVGLIAVDVKDKVPHEKGDYILDGLGVRSIFLASSLGHLSNLL
jgi:hypothetical protein